MISCSKCNKNFIDGTRFCTVCGTDLIKQAQERELQEQLRREKEARLSYKLMFLLKSIPKKVWAIAGCVVLALGIGVFAWMAYLEATAERNYVVYFKDEKLYLNIKDGKEVVELVDFADELASISYVGYESVLSLYVSEHTVINETANRVFYPQNFSYLEDQENFDLYYCNLDNPKKSQKIAEKVYEYSVSSDGNLMIYSTKDGVFAYDFDEHTRIADSRYGYVTAADEHVVLYIDVEEGLFCWKYGEGAKKLGSNLMVSSLHVGQNGNLTYYVEDNTLFKYEYGHKPVAIATNVSRSLQAYENGGVYYQKDITSTINLSDYVIDNYIESDATMIRPAYPDFYNYPWNEQPYDEVYAQYQKDVKQYKEQLKIWEGKAQREQIRENLKGQTIQQTSYALYYYDGESEHQLTDNCIIDGALYSGQDAKPAITCVVKGDVVIPKRNIENIESVSAFYSEVIDLLNTPEVTEMVFSEAMAYQIEIDNISTKVFSHDGKKMYFVSLEEGVIEEDKVKYERFPYGTLYEIELEEHKGIPVEYDTEVIADQHYLYPLKNGELIYFKGNTLLSSDFSGTLYISGEKIAEEVHLTATQGKDGESLYFIKDIEADGATLFCYKGGEVTEVDDHVYIKDSFSPAENGGIFYLTRYNASEKKGKLYYWKDGKESQLIDKDVMDINVP